MVTAWVDGGHNTMMSLTVISAWNMDLKEVLGTGKISLDWHLLSEQLSKANHKIVSVWLKRILLF